MRTLETERLLLRPFCENDLEDLFRYASKPEVGPAAGWPPHTCLEDSRQVLRRFLEQEDTLAIVPHEIGRAVGSVSLTRDAKRSNDRARMLGYAMDSLCWGRGYMTETARRMLRFAFEERGMELVSVYHYPFNQRSRRVIEKCGFRYEGTFRRSTILPDGTVCDDVCYSITREEYWSDSLCKG